ncbi:hypothetical protein [Lysobacter panacisoli]|uniref:Secreted protein n=1 Tax=Lysobacter panacisoli TaxID=1255263 RepID=A0ABP9LVL3_9GAMM|nr:hypothetical protein [Lysobacter panacisoli]
MSITSFVAASLIGLATGQAGSAPPADAEPKQAQVASEAVRSTDDEDKLVCRRVRKTGSNMMTNDCRTVGQRRKDTEAAREILRDRPDFTRGN